MHRPLACLLLAASTALAAPQYRGGAVAAAHPLGAEAGRELLDAGGNAVDAAVAAAFVMAVVGPYHSGLGGGGFALVHDLKQGDAAFDFREVAPSKASRDMFLRDGKPVPELSLDGALSVGVPGAIKGYLELQAKYGRLPRAKVLAPAIRIARAGFWVSPKYRELAKSREDCLRKDPEAARLFLRPGADGRPAAPALGTLLTQPELARTLETLARQGDAPFYEGALGKAAVATVQAAGGLLSEADLKGYRTAWRTPLEGSYRGHRLLTMPPPSAGGLAVVQVLALLEANGPQGPATREVEVLHVFIEAMRRAYVDRAKYLGDPAFVQIPLEALRSKEHLDELRASIDPKKATPSRSLLATPGESADKHTTHLSVIDKDGNAAALTTTLNYAFGSCLVAKGTGILLNDQLDDFAAQPGTPNAYGLVTGEANAVAPGKRPLSSMSPTLVFQQGRPAEVMLAVGSPGGATIPTTVIQVISNVIDGRLDVVRAVGFGRIHHQYLPDQVLVDLTGLEPATAAALEAKGHVLKREERWGDAEAVLVDPETGLRSASSDPRNEGAPAGQP